MNSLKMNPCSDRWAGLQWFIDSYNEFVSTSRLASISWIAAVETCIFLITKVFFYIGTYHTFFFFLKHFYCVYLMYTAWWLGSIAGAKVLKVRQMSTCHPVTSPLNWFRWPTQIRSDFAWVPYPMQELVYLLQTSQCLSCFVPVKCRGYRSYSDKGTFIKICTSFIDFVFNSWNEPMMK